MPKPRLPSTALAFFRAQGAIGGRASSQRLTAEERQARAAAAGRASGRARRKKKKPITYPS